MAEDDWWKIGLGAAAIIGGAYLVKKMLEAGKKKCWSCQKMIPEESQYCPYCYQQQR